MLNNKRGEKFLIQKYFVLFLLVLSFSFTFISSSRAQDTILEPINPELCGPECDACENCPQNIQNNHIRIRNQVMYEFMAHRIWTVGTYFNEFLEKSLSRMTGRLTVTSLQQMQIIGSFFDAKHQLETQRLLQTLTAKAHKDYHPSQNLCNVGTNTRYMGQSKRQAEFAQAAVSERMMARQLNRADGISFAPDANSDMRSRIDDFIEKYCDPNGGGRGNSGGASFARLCQNANVDRSQVNADVNFTSTIENKLTLENSFLEPGNATSNDEENVFALGSNLFAHKTMPYISRADLILPDGMPTGVANLYYDLRALAAKRSVAQNSFAAITGLRAEGAEQSGPFLKAILEEAGIEGADVEIYLGENPSYFAQEEVMMKILYQNPDFYANLYDKPANVERMGVALLALEIIQDRNIYESLLRSEATLATLIETNLIKEQRRISGDLKSLDAFGRLRGE